MLTHPNFNPVAIHLGPLAVRWYGLMYVVAFIAAIVIGRLRLRLLHIAAQGWTTKDIDDMMFYGILGTILGGRLGYVLFYKANFYFTHPLDIVTVWQGGMSFHGGLLGGTLAMILFAYQRQRTWLQVTDFVATMAPGARLHTSGFHRSPDGGAGLLRCRGRRNSSRQPVCALPDRHG